MAKRFSDSSKWDDPFFSDLSNDYKLLWIYMLDKCNHAGIFKVNKKMVEFCLNTKFDWKDIEGVFKGRIHPLNHEKWFIIKFIEYQYGVLTENNRVHNSIIQILKKEGVYKLCQRVVLGPKDKDKDKDKDKVKEIIEDFNIVFGSNYKITNKVNYDLIISRLNDDFTLEDFKVVHRKMLKNWGADAKMYKYLRPQTLYSNKFESYLNMREFTTKLTETGIKAYLIGQEWLKKQEIIDAK